MVSKMIHSQDLIREIFSLLKEEKFSAEENQNICQQIIENKDHATCLFHLSYVFWRLKEVNLLTYKNCFFLVEHLEYLDNIYQGLLWIFKDKNIFTERNCSLLLQYPEHAKNIGEGFHILQSHEFLPEGYQEILVCHREYAEIVAQGFWCLEFYDLYTEENCRLLLRHPEHAHDLAVILGRLKRLDLLADDKRDFFVQHPEYIATIYGGIFWLSDTHKESHLLLFQYPEYAETIARGFSFSKMADISFAEYQDLISQHKEYVANIVEGVAYLKKSKIFTDQYYHLLLQHPKYAVNLAKGFRGLTEEEMFTNENLHLLLQHPRNAVKIARGFYWLKKLGLLTVENCNLIVRAADHIDVDEMIGGLQEFYFFEKMTPEQQQKSFRILIQHAAFYDEIIKRIQNVELPNGILTHDIFNTIVNTVRAEHNTQRVAVEVSFFRANPNSTIATSVFPLINYTIAAFVGMRSGT